MPFLQCPTSRIYYEEYGAGYPVLLLAPGFLASRIERWRTNPNRPGVEQAWADPVPVLQNEFRLIAMDQRNAGLSRGTAGSDDGWLSYTKDHIALLEHLGIKRCHVFGACIGVSFAFALFEARPDLVAAMILQNPIGRSADNQSTIDRMFGQWADQARLYPGIVESELDNLKQRMFGGDFIFSVPESVVGGCKSPMVLMPGDDQEHPASISQDLQRLAPHMNVVQPWKGPALRDNAMQQVLQFLREHTPDQMSPDVDLPT